MTRKNNLGQVFNRPVEGREFPTDNSWTLPECNIGVEIEMEEVPITIMKRLVTKHYGKLWEWTEEGSLKNGVEIRFAYPLCGYNLTNGISFLKFLQDSIGLEPKFNTRTSTHIHLDVRDLLPHQLTNFIILVMIFEQAIFNLCTKDRHASNYCVPTYDRPYAMNSLPHLDNETHLRNMVRAGNKYTACNLASIEVRGSIEFRMFHGTINPETITFWINMLMSLKKYAVDLVLNDGETIPRLISIKGVYAFTREVFGDDTFLVFEEQPLSTSMYRGARRAEQICERDKLVAGSEELKGNTVITYSDFVPKPKTKKPKAKKKVKKKIAPSDLDIFD